MATLPDYAFGLQGVLLVANGIYTLLYPTKAAGPSSPMAGTPVSTVHAMRFVSSILYAFVYTLADASNSSSMTSFSLGFIFLQVAYQRNRDFMVTAVPMRFVAAIVFYCHGGRWRNVAWYEAGWGVLSILSLLW
jgi:hypothetical protein